MNLSSQAFDQNFGLFFQIRSRFGALDEIVERQVGRLRKCSWVRFLRMKQQSKREAEIEEEALRNSPPSNSEESKSSPNLCCSRLPSGHVIYETLAEIPPHCELVADFSSAAVQDGSHDLIPALELANSMLLRALSELMSGKQD